MAFHEPGSGHGEEASHHVHVTTVATRHPEAEDGPSGEPMRGTAPLEKVAEQSRYGGTLQHFWSTVLNDESCLTLNVTVKQENITRIDSMC